MNVKITARHVKITEEVKEYLNSKINNLDKYFNRIKCIEVILDHNKNSFEVEIVVSVIRGKKIVAKISNNNYVAAIDILIDKLERQLTKFKEIKREQRVKLHNMPDEHIRELETEGLNQDDWY